MIKFIVTGTMRSGTTLTASILNSQKNTFCVEDYPWIKFPKKLKFSEDFHRFSNKLDAQFIYLGLSEPRLLERANVNDNLIDLYVSHLKEIFKCENVGFKRTMMPEAEMVDRTSNGYKIVILKRDTEKILRSWANRIDADVYTAAYRLSNWLIDNNYYSPAIPDDTYIVINFDELVNNLDKTLGELENFLGIKIQNPTTLYHSFNKNRSPFEKNSSFVDFGPHSLAKSLPNKYDDQIYKNLARQIDSGNFRPNLKQFLVRVARYVKAKI